MLIGIDASRALRSRRTGAENYSVQLIRQLMSQARGHVLRLYCQERPPAGLFSPPDGAGVCVGRELRVIPLPRLWTHARLSAEMIASPPDLLFVPAHVLPLVHPRRSVVTVHDLGYHFYPQAHRNRDRIYLEVSTRFNARAAAHVLVDSQATRDDLVRVCDADPGKITVVHLGRDEGLQPMTDPQRLRHVQRKLGLERGGEPRPYVLYVGTLQPRKNLARLIDAFAMTLDLKPGLTLVLAGQPGWLVEPIKRRVTELGLEGRVLFPGYIDDEDLPALLSGAELFAFPSLYEGFGMPVLEAQACGAPVLTSSTSSLPEVAGDAALLVDPLDTAALARGLRLLLCDAPLRDRLRAAGFANVQRFSWRRCAEQTLAVLEMVGLT
jgi:glycosyltransferase involved in cell wall biosynthesis